jgi:hypothetical protein
MVFGWGNAPPQPNVKADRGGIAASGDITFGLDEEGVRRLLQEELARIAGEKGVPLALLVPALKKLGADSDHITVEEFPKRFAAAVDELIQLRADLAELRDRPEFGAISTQALALIDAGDFDAARAALDRPDVARALRHEASGSEAESSRRVIIPMTCSLHDLPYLVIFRRNSIHGTYDFDQTALVPEGDGAAAKPPEGDGAAAEPSEGDGAASKLNSYQLSDLPFQSVRCPHCSKKAGPILCGGCSRLVCRAGVETNGDYFRCVCGASDELKRILCTVSGSEDDASQDRVAPCSLPHHPQTSLPAPPSTRSLPAPPSTTHLLPRSRR